MRGTGVLVIGAVAAVLLASAGTVRAGEHGPLAASLEGCHESGDLLTAPERLVRARSALKDRWRLSVVAIGSSSTQGHGASAPERAYPAQLEYLLEQKFPGLDATVRNVGVGGQDAQDMTARFARDVYPAEPDLVIWQTGTNDAIHRVPLAAFEATLRQGLQALRGQGYDVILMLPQYAPQFADVPDHDGYLAAMRKVAGDEGAAVFDRYDTSWRWMRDQRFAATPVLTGDGLHQSDAGYRCVAELLADGLAALTAD